MKKFEAVYLCVGENHGYDVQIGDCGEKKTLGQWLEHLFPYEPPQMVKDFFKEDSAAEIVGYILKNKGKRLERMEK